MSTLPSDDRGPASPGGVDFKCTGCGRLLTIGPESSGGQAQCPECGAIQRVPEASGNPASPTAPIGVDDYGAAPSRPVAAGAPPEDGISFLEDDGPASLSPNPPAGPVVSPGPAVSPKSPSPTTFPSTSLSGLGTMASGEPTGSPTPTKKLFDRITTELRKIFVGQDELVLGTLVALFSSGHVLIESVPGLGKTLFVRTLGRILGCQFGRIQFTADLMPSDITGAPIFDMKTQEFRFFPGPVFTQLLLADEINRSPAKTHAALLEIMQEYRVTIDGKTHRIERPFFVLATQNPIESEGTYNLPEAQLDRFMFKLVANYPTETEEAAILKLHSRQVDINKRLEEEIDTVTSSEEILQITRASGDVRIDGKLLDYINKIVRLTRESPQFHMGASPRAGLALMQGARTLAAFFGRDYAVPDDVVRIVLPALRHRVILTAEAEVEGQAVDDILTQLLRSVEVPRL